MSVATIIVIIAVVIGFELAATITWVFAQMPAFVCTSGNDGRRGRAALTRVAVEQCAIGSAFIRTGRGDLSTQERP